MKIAQGLKAQARLAQKGLLVATVLVSLLAASKAVAASEVDSGSARNGVGRSGVSIPVDVDGALTVAQFNAAKEICRGEVVKDLLSQILRQEVTEVKFAEMQWRYVKFLANQVRADLWVHIPESMSSSGPTFAFRYRTGNGEETYLDYGGVENQFKVDPRVAEMVKNAQSTYATFVGGLAVNYETQKDSGYDELATLVHGKVLIRKFTVTDGPVYRLVRDPQTNEVTKRPVSLKLMSAEDYKTCLQDNFGR